MKAKEITCDQFDAKLGEMISAMTEDEILAIPGVYEAVSEALNNDIIDALCDDDDGPTACPVCGSSDCIMADDGIPAPKFCPNAGDVL